MANERITLRRTLIRNKIIDVALKEFNCQGYERATTAQIADILGMTGPSLYYYFRNKDELLLACVESLMSRLVEGLQAATLKGGTSLDIVRRLVHTQVRHELTLASVGTMVNAYLYGPEHMIAMLAVEEKNRLREMQRNLVQVYRQAFQRAMEDGSIGEQDLSILTFNALAVIQYTAVWYQSAGRFDLEAIAQRQADAVLALIGARVQ
jgi:AcrR family transcriptional regulator